MIKLDITQVQDAGQTFFSSADVAYLIFLLIGIVGYFCVPSVAAYIVNAGSSRGLLHKVNAVTVQATIFAANTTIEAGSRAAQKLGDLLKRKTFGTDPDSDQHRASRFSGKN